MPSDTNCRGNIKELSENLPSIVYACIHVWTQCATYNAHCLESDHPEYGSQLKTKYFDSEMLTNCCHYSQKYWNCTSKVACVLMVCSESNARKHAGVRFNLQQQMVYRHVHHSLPQQERLVCRENSNLAVDYMLS